MLRARIPVELQRVPKAEAARPGVASAPRVETSIWAQPSALSDGDVLGGREVTVAFRLPRRSGCHGGRRA